MCLLFFNLQDLFFNVLNKVQASISPIGFDFVYQRQEHTATLL